MSSEIANYYTADRSEIVELLRGEGRSYGAALDIGCAAGGLGSELVRNGIARHCDGIEPNAAAAELAGGVLRNVWCGPMEAVQDNVPWRSYGLVVMADVLEHFVDPWAALRLLHESTDVGCSLALSVPNVRHYRVSIPLVMNGTFRYVDDGIMDRTHLHFFTRESLEETLRECGWRIERIVPRMRSKYRRWYFPTKLLEPFVTVQYLLVCRKDE